MEGDQTNVPGPGPRSARCIALDMFRVYGHAFARMLTAAAIVMVPLMLAGHASFGTDFVSLLAGTPGGTPTQLHGATVVALTAYAFLYLIGMLAAGGAVVEQAARNLIGSDISIGRAYGIAIKRMPAMLGAGLIAALAAGLPLALVASSAGSVLTIADLIFVVLTVIVATYVAVRLMFAIFVSLLEQASPLEAVTRSWRLVSGMWRHTFIRFLLVTFLAGVIQVALQYAASAVPTAGGIISTVAVAPLTAIGNLLIYLDLRARREGYSAATLTAELESLARCKVSQP